MVVSVSRKKKDIPYYRGTPPIKLTDRQKINILNIKVTSAEDRADRSEKYLLNIKKLLGNDTLETLNETIIILTKENEKLQSMLRDSLSKSINLPMVIAPDSVAYKRGYNEGFFLGLEKGKNSWKFWNNK